MTSVHGDELPSRRRRTRSHLAATTISAVICVVVDLIALFAVGSAVLIEPDGPWDDSALSAIDVSALTGGLVAALGALIRVLPVVRHWLRPWWFLPPVGLLLVAMVRLASVRPG